MHARIGAGDAAVVVADVEHRPARQPIEALDLEPQVAPVGDPDQRQEPRDQRRIARVEAPPIQRRDLHAALRGAARASAAADTRVRAATVAINPGHTRATAPSATCAAGRTRPCDSAVDSMTWPATSRAS